MFYQNRPIANSDIRQAISASGLYLWQVAEALGMADSSFSRKLRCELSDDYKQRIYQAIDELKQREA